MLYLLARVRYQLSVIFFILFAYFELRLGLFQLELDVFDFTHEVVNCVFDFVGAHVVDLVHQFGVVQGERPDGI